VCVYVRMYIYCMHACMYGWIYRFIYQLKGRIFFFKSIHIILCYYISTIATETVMMSYEKILVKNCSVEFKLYYIRQLIICE